LGFLIEPRPKPRDEKGIEKSKTKINYKCRQQVQSRAVSALPVLATCATAMRAGAGCLAEQFTSAVAL